MSLEEAILNAVRALPTEKQQEILTHVTRLRDQTIASRPRRSVKGLWADLGISLSAEESMRINARCGKTSPGKHLMSAVAVDTHTIVWYLAADRRLSAKAMGLGPGYRGRKRDPRSLDLPHRTHVFGGKRKTAIDCARAIDSGSGRSICGMQLGAA